MTTLHIPPQDLPGWMRQATRGTDWGVLLAIAFSVIAAWPFLLQPGLPRTNASENHVFRTADTAAALQEGRLYPRWSPYAYGGYGAPIPHFYPPASAYSAAVIQLLFTNDAVDAVRISYIAALIGAGAASYALVMRRAGAAAGLLASILYVFSPYVGLTAPVIQGDLPAVIGLMLLPGLLWAIDRLIVLNRPTDLLLTSIAACLLLLTHLQLALIGLGLAAGYTLAFSGPPTNRTREVSTAILLGLLLAAFYWLPALLEYPFVQRWEVMQPSRMALDWRTLFLPLRPIDPSELTHMPQLTLGPALALLGLTACVLLPRPNTARRFHGYFALCSLILIALIIVAPSQSSLIGPLALCAAITASGVIHQRQKFTERIRRFILVAILTGVLAASLPTLLAPQWPAVYEKPGPVAQIVYENAGFGSAVLPTDAAVPIVPSAEMPENRILTSMIQAGEITRIAPGSINSNMQASLLRYSAHELRFLVRVNTPTTFNLLLTGFPGWKAELNGVPVPVRIIPETGLLTVEVPSTFNRELELVISMGPTPARQAGWAIAATALTAILLLVRVRSQHTASNYNDLLLLSRAEVRFISIVFIAFLLVFCISAVPGAAASIRQPSGYKLANTLPLNSFSDTGLTLVAYRVEHRLYQPGETIDLTLFWKSLRNQQENVQISVYLRGQASDSAVVRVPYHAPGFYPTRRWLPDAYVSDNYQLTLPKGLSPGEYFIMIEGRRCASSCSDGTPLTFFDRVGQAVGGVLALPVAIRVG